MNNSKNLEDLLPSAHSAPHVLYGIAFKHRRSPRGIVKSKGAGKSFNTEVLAAHAS